ncbi:hypothetical protein HK098_002591 [Nowakowskiella sp. JEL0407]|nr:hypothetical protein HK098_002591 [Nowakowskiella sp. JEL0407]
MEKILKLDAFDEFNSSREDFLIPKLSDVSKSSAGGDNTDCVYLCGNSLGLQPKLTSTLLNEELNVWASRGVIGHFDHPESRPWVSVETNVIPQLSKIVGAKESETIIMNTLTTNLHLLLVSFYTPTKDRFKIIMEGKAFPSDHYAIESQLKFHGYSSSALIEIQPEPDSDYISPSSILAAIEEHGNETALILFSGVQYYSGQFFPMKDIVDAGHRKGCIVGFDLAHAVGNVVLKLHDWNVDFACWCTYKYLNSGPGSIAGAFVHEKHHKNFDRPRFDGWWGTNPKTRFQMSHTFEPQESANAFCLSNPCVLSTTALLASSKVFAKYSMEDLQRKSRSLGKLLLELLNDLDGTMRQDRTDSECFTIITPMNESERGCQVSIKFGEKVMSVRVISEKLRDMGIIVDEREPNVIRVAPVPLYNTHMDVYKFVSALGKILEVPKYS